MARQSQCVSRTVLFSAFLLLFVGGACGPDFEQIENPPTLLTPEPNEVLDWREVSFSWDMLRRDSERDYTGVDSYELWAIIPNADPSLEIPQLLAPADGETLTVSDLSITVEVPVTDEPITWWVLARNNLQRFPSVRQRFRVELAIPVADAPAAAADVCSDAATFTWTGISIADSYNVIVYDDAEGTNEVARLDGAVSPADGTSLNLANGTSYTWRVEALRQGDSVIFSEPASFTWWNPVSLTPASLTDPGDSCGNPSTVTLTWDDVGATQHWLDVELVGSPLATDTTDTGSWTEAAFSNRSVDVDLTPGEYQWKLAASNPGCSEVEAVAAGTFVVENVALPTIDDPLDLCEMDPATVNWQMDGDFDVLEVRLVEDDGSPVEMNYTDVSGVNTYDSVTIAAAGFYSFEFRATRNDPTTCTEIIGNSPVFEVLPIPAINMQNVTACAGEPIVLSWTGAAAGTYTSTVDGNMIPVTPNGTSYEATYTPGLGDVGSTFDWVVTHDASALGCAGMPTETRQITVVAPPVIDTYSVSAVTIDAGDPVTINFTGTDVTSFDVEVFDGASMSTFTQAGVTDGFVIPGTAFTAGGSYTVTLTANGDAACTPVTQDLTVNATAPCVITSLEVGFDSLCQVELTVTWTNACTAVELRTTALTGSANNTSVTSPATFTTADIDGWVAMGGPQTVNVGVGAATDSLDLPEATSDLPVIISEMCDPQSNFNEDRFLEITNLSDYDVDMTGWTIFVRVNSGLGNFVTTAQANVEVDTSDGAFAYEVGLLNPVLLSGESRILVDDDASWGSMATDWVIQVPNSSGSFVTTQEWFNWNGQERDGVQLEDACGNFIDTSWTDPTGGSSTGFFDNSYAERRATVTGPSGTFNGAEWTTASASSYTDCSPRTH